MENVTNITIEPWKKPRNNLGTKGCGGWQQYQHVGGINSSFDNHLFGALDPINKGATKLGRNLNIQHEKPVHRLMQELLSKGHTFEEIATFTGYTPQRVSIILRQPWAQRNIVKTIAKSVQDEIKDFLESEVMPSLKLLTNLRDDPEVPAAVRKDSALAVIDRLMGKPNQPITTQVSDPSKLSNDELTKRVSTILGSGTPSIEGVGNSNEDPPLTGQVGGN